MTHVDFDDHLKSTLSNENRRRRYAQNSVVVDTTVAMNRALEASGLTQRQLAVRLGRTEGFVSQVMSGGGNLTLRTLGDFAYGLGCDVEISLCPHAVSRSAWALDSGTIDQPKAANTQLALAA